VDIRLYKKATQILSFADLSNRGKPPRSHGIERTRGGMSDLEDTLRAPRTLVMGASSGIGHELVRQLSTRGAYVVACARRVERMADLADVVVHGCDVRDAEQCATAVTRATEVMGGLDVLVYSAGLSRITPLDSAGHQEWSEVFATNVFGAAMVTRASIPHLCDPDSEGRALYLTSTSAELAFPGLVAYSASKAALSRYCQGLAVEFPSLRVSEVVVGPTAGTGVADNFEPAAFEKWATRWFEEGFVRHGMQQPAEVAALIVDAIFDDAPPARLDVAGQPELVATTLEEGRTQAEGQ
jgi:NAD(P)-dependent dehydrogenase (short-subunit alcohol dehydrogenase family)